MSGHHLAGIQGSISIIALDIHIAIKHNSTNLQKEQVMKEYLPN